MIPQVESSSLSAVVRFVAQLVEQRPFKSFGVGSSPAEPIHFFRHKTLTERKTNERITERVPKENRNDRFIAVVEDENTIGGCACNYSILLERCKEQAEKFPGRKIQIFKLVSEVESETTVNVKEF